MITRERKRELLKELQEKAEKAKLMLFTTFSGITVPEISNLRRSIKENGGELKVYRNTLLKMGLTEKGFEVDDEIFTGPTAVVFGYEDPFPVMKVVNDFQKSHRRNFDIKGGLLGTLKLTKSDIKELSSLSSMQELYGKLVWGMKAPLARLVFALKYPAMKLIFVLNQIKDKKA
ncbi:MAG: 50S ribosomal protein L10 [Caldisericia bacterium]|nr:50S ribosomal protein L10 [Caldisericia bacterium]